MGNWTLGSIAWDRFDASKVDPEILRNIKAAALVERNGGDYRIYLNRVFADDPEFIQSVDTWSREEVQHGRALRRWAELADPAFDFSVRIDELEAQSARELFAYRRLAAARQPDQAHAVGGIQHLRHAEGRVEVTAPS